MKVLKKNYLKLSFILPVLLLAAMMGGFLCADVFGAMPNMDGRDMQGVSSQLPLNGQSDCQMDSNHGQVYFATINAADNFLKISNQLPIAIMTFVGNRFENHYSVAASLSPPLLARASFEPLGVVLRC